MDNPEVIHHLKGNVIIPIATIKQLDGLKSSENQTKANAARRASRVIDEATGEKGSNVRVYTEYDPIEGLNSPADNKIVGAAVRLKKENGSEVVLLTTDVNMRNVARGWGVEGLKIYDIQDLEIEEEIKRLEESLSIESKNTNSKNSTDRKKTNIIKELPIILFSIGGVIAIYLLAKVSISLGITAFFIFIGAIILIGVLSKEDIPQPVELTAKQKKKRIEELKAIQIRKQALSIKDKSNNKKDDDEYDDKYLKDTFYRLAGHEHVRDVGILSMEKEDWLLP